MQSKIKRLFVASSHFLFSLRISNAKLAKIKYVYVKYTGLKVHVDVPLVCRKVSLEVLVTCSVPGELMSLVVDTLMRFWDASLG